MIFSICFLCSGFIRIFLCSASHNRHEPHCHNCALKPSAIINNYVDKSHKTASTCIKIFVCWVPETNIKYFCVIHSHLLSPKWSRKDIRSSLILEFEIPYFPPKSDKNEYLWSCIYHFFIGRCHAQFIIYRVCLYWFLIRCDKPRYVTWEICESRPLKTLRKTLTCATFDRFPANFYKILNVFAFLRTTLNKIWTSHLDNLFGLYP